METGESSSRQLQVGLNDAQTEAQIELRTNELKEDIESGLLFHRQKTVGADGRRVKAPCWNLFHEIFDVAAPNEAI